VQFKLGDPGPLLYGTEPILLDGSVAGYLTSGAYGHTLGAAVGLGYVPCGANDDLQKVLEGRFEIEVAGERVAALASLRPMYDPDRGRMLA
jgi:4-methylaminobutanoate oxidase (formaldehyde-forming)